MLDPQDDDNRRPRRSVRPLEYFIAAAAVLILLYQISQAGEGSGMGSGMGASLPALSVYDGDTFTLDGERIRISGIDTPELRNPICDAERKLARLARLKLVSLLGSGAGISVERHPLPDRYGRTLARVTVNGRDVAPVLIREGLAVQWAGKRHSWCCG